MAATLAQTQARLTQEHDNAALHLQEQQHQLIDAMQKGYALSASLVERIFEAEELVRSLRQLAGLGDTATDAEELKGRLREWMADATERLTSPGHSRSTSLVRTEQMMAETEGLKHGLRVAERYVRSLTD